MCLKKSCFLPDGPPLGWCAVLLALYWLWTMVLAATRTSGIFLMISSQMSLKPLTLVHLLLEQRHEPDLGEGVEGLLRLAFVVQVKEGGEVQHEEEHCGGVHSHPTIST